MKFLLVIPKFAKHGLNYEFPLGLAYISAALKEASYEVHCLNLNHHDWTPDEMIAETIGAIDPDVCATGALSVHYDEAKKIIDAARRAKPSVRTVLGGGLVGSDPKLAFGLLDMDVGVIGEGEETIVELAQAFSDERPLGEVKGIIHAGADGEGMLSPPRNYIRDLDALPRPDYEGFGIEEFLRTQYSINSYELHPVDDPRCLPVISSRSCPYSCTFCYHPTGRVYRQRSLDMFFAELDELVDRYDLNLLAILDELFAMKRDRLIEFCKRIKSYGLQWTVQMHVNAINGEVLDRMKDAGCCYISLGLESFDATVLKSMQKKATPERIEQALNQVYDRKIGIQGNFIFGDAAETEQTIDNTLGWWAVNRKFQISISRLQVYPGTPLYQRALEEGKISNTDGVMPPDNVNMTAIESSHYAYIMSKLMVYRETLTIPGKNLVVEVLDGEDPLRGAIYRVEWDCPRCGAHNLYSPVPLNNPLDHQGFYLSCRSCLSRFNFENTLFPPWIEPRTEEILAEGKALAAQGRNNEAMARYLKLTQISFPKYVLNRPRAVNRANYEIGMLCLPREDMLSLAVLHLGLALRQNVFDPESHLAFALALAWEGCCGGARLHCDMALALAGDGKPLAGELMEPLEARLAAATAEENRRYA
ncbi:MAG: hypothetical protein CMF63_06835 [Magnetovibrio sp.]|nr:hypothetical protein [Magnetovibrio sp.]